jgi:shikimate kinase
MSVVLIGYRGSGKSSVGRKLADRLWQSFVDTDDMIAKAAGKPIREIFEQDGEQHFRDLEADAVHQACAMQDHVIALGGGAVLRDENRSVIRQSGHRVVYLRCEPHVLLARIQSDPRTATSRPSLTALGGGIEEIQSLLAQREPLYREVMSFELDVTNLSVADACVHITRVM